MEVWKSDMWFYLIVLMYVTEDNKCCYEYIIWNIGIVCYELQWHHKWTSCFSFRFHPHDIVTVLYRKNIAILLYIYRYRKTLYWSLSLSFFFTKSKILFVGFREIRGYVKCTQYNRYTHYRKISFKKSPCYKQIGIKAGIFFGITFIKRRKHQKILLI